MQQVVTEEISESSSILLEIGKVFGGHVPNIFKAYGRL